MKGKECLEIGVACGLETIEEAVLNVKLHHANLFSYTDTAKEIEELSESCNELYQCGGFRKSSRCEDALAWLTGKQKTESDLRVR